MNRKLAAYFSTSGVTEKAAKLTDETADADIFEIEPVIPYTGVAFNWVEKNKFLKSRR